MTCQYSRLNKDGAAVLLTAHQAGLISRIQDYPSNTFKNNILTLANVAKFCELPTILTIRFEHGPSSPMVSELKRIFPDAPQIVRPGQINAWDNEDFVAASKGLGNLLSNHIPLHRGLMTSDGARAGNGESV